MPERTENLNLPDLVRAAGVVGAGGAGFPTHLKLRGRTEYLILNACECEPLVRVDQELLLDEADVILEALALVAKQMAAERVIIGLKAKYKPVLEAIEPLASQNGIEIVALGDHYPVGDEHILVKEVTGRTVPPGGIPPQVGAVVLNVETAFNIARAMRGQPVTEKFVTVSGAVRHPCTLRVPVGTSLRECLTAAGGPAVEDYVFAVGGPMTGTFTEDADLPVDKRTKAVVVMPATNNTVRKTSLSLAAMARRTGSACCLCRACTDLCPRYLLGHPLEPHKVMRAIAHFSLADFDLLKMTLLCCECRVCDRYACPMDLTPGAVMGEIKRTLLAQGVKVKWRLRETGPTLEGRRIPTSRLLARLGVSQYEGTAPLLRQPLEPQKVSLPLQQHSGVAARPLVRAGERVKVGEIVAEVAEKAVGAHVHASIEGVVSAVNSSITIEAR